MLTTEQVSLNVDALYCVNAVFIARIKIDKKGKYILTYDEQDYFILEVNPTVGGNRAYIRLFSVTSKAGKKRKLIIEPSPVISQETTDE